MKKSRINLDRPDLPDEKILQHKNFEKTFKVYQQTASGSASGSGSSQGVAAITKSVFRSLNFWGIAGSAVLVATVATLTIINSGLKQENGVDNQLSENPDSSGIIENNGRASFIRPPVKDIRIAYEDFDIDVSKENEITTSTGSKITVPPYSFVDDTGMPVEGKVQIRYREFHNPVDIFLSGIPMNYDSAGTSYQFESAGMLEILAYHSGAPVCLASDQQIKIDMISYNDDPKFNQYYLDTVEKRWKFTGKDEIAKLDLPAGSSKEKMPEYMDVSLIDPIVPVQANKEKYLVEIEMDLSGHPELVNYEGLVFEVNDTENTFDPKFYDVDWEKAVLKKTEKTGVYSLEMTRMDHTEKFTVLPVFDAENIEKAQKTYERQMRRNAEEKKKRAAWQEKHGDKTNTPQLTGMTDELVGEVMQKANYTWPVATRTLMISSIGIHNCDIPNPFQNGTAFIPIFVDTEGERIDYVYAYVVDKMKNALYRTEQGRPVYCNIKADNLIWIVTEKGQMGFVLTEETDKIGKNKDSYKLVADVTDNIEGIRRLNQYMETDQKIEIIAPGKIDSEQINESNMQAEENRWKVYPNPFTDIIKIECTHDQRYNIEVINISGETVKTGAFRGTCFEWNLAYLASGAYVLRICSDDKKFSETFRIIKR